MTEQQLHRSVVQLLAVYAARGLLAYCHPANGELRSAATAGRLKGMGLVAGVPDLLIWAPFEKHFQIELKAGRRGPTPAQLDWAARMADMGIEVRVCRSVDEVEAALRAEGIPPVGTMDRRPA